VTDSRIQQAIAALDDARTTLADLYEDCPKAWAGEISRVRGSINIGILALQKLNDPRCQVVSVWGSQCVLDNGHDGKHRNQRGFEWIDGSQADFVRKNASRFD
jgi:hypothetical protein